VGAARPAEADVAESVAPESPEGFRLAGDAPRVMRLSRKTLAVAGGVAGTAIGGALLWALQPTSPKSLDNLYRAHAGNRADAVTSAPTDYGALSKLGPPLPADLGQPIAAAQQEGEAVPMPTPGRPPSARDPAAEARERAAQEREAARASRLFLGGSTGNAERAIADAVPAAIQPPPTTPAEGTTTSAAGRKAFMASGGRDAESLERVREPSSINIVQAGSVIPAALITGIRSDLPGQVTAQVTQNVYDSPTGNILLIPQGARLVGEYDSDISRGQDRVLLAWERLILPGGRSIRLGREPGADAAGMAGLSDRTNFHWGRMLRAALVSTLLGVGAELGSDSEDRLVRALREGAQDTAGQTGRQVVERELRVPPTLTIRPGFALRVLVTRDLVLEPVAGGGRP
jgi:type IV secretion system protein VirB10